MTEGNIGMSEQDGKRPPVQFGLKRFLFWVLIGCCALSCIVSCGWPSTLVLVAHGVYLYFVVYSITKDWKKKETDERIFAGIGLVVCFALIPFSFPKFWIESEFVRESRAEAMCQLQPGVGDIDVEITHAKGLYVSVTGTVDSEDSLRPLRKQMFWQFRGETAVSIDWDILIESTDKRLKGDDEDLFP